MQTNTNRFITIICIVFLTVAGIFFFSRVTDRRDDDYKYAPFFREETDYDVLFFGTSHVIYGIYPMNLWEQFGLTSYNFGGHGNSLAVSYLQFENAIRYHKPKIAVLDVCGAYRNNNEMVYAFEQAHISMDAFPLTATKIKGVREAFPDKAEQLELLLPFSSYHARWSELNGNAYLAPFVGEAVTKEKGAESAAGIAEGYEEVLISRDERWDEYTVSMDYIQRFIDTCRAEGIEPVLIFLPDPAGKEAKLGANSVYNIAEKNGVPYINFTYEEKLVDSQTDFFDTDAHLNMLGAGKITEYLGKYLVKNYDLREQACEAWKEEAGAFREMLLNRAAQQQELTSLLSMLYSPYYTGELYISGDYEFSAPETAILEELQDRITVNRVSGAELQNGESVYLFLLDFKDQNGDVLLRIER